MEVNMVEQGHLDEMSTLKKEPFNGSRSLQIPLRLLPQVFEGNC